MHLDRLLVYFNTSPALRLLRSQNAPFILDFLHTQFKQTNRITVPSSELSTALNDYREQIQGTYPDALPEKSEVYLAGWCSNETRWLHRFLEAGRNEPSFELTPHTEEVFAFLDRALQQEVGFVGTESRLRLIIDTLADIVLGASDDPQVRLTHLNQEIARLENEVRRLEREGVTSRYEPAQTRERFGVAVALLKSLLGDFRAVEERFKDITAQVQQRQIEGRDTRGGILGFALDAEDLLKEEDQGVSFYEFVAFILSPIQQEKLQAIIQQLEVIDELAELEDGLTTVRRMVPSLLAEAEKVMRTSQRLSATLRRLLDTKMHGERQRVAYLLRDIQQLAVGFSNQEAPTDAGIDVDVEVTVRSPFARTFWSEPPRFEQVNLTDRVLDADRCDEVFRMLAQMQKFEWRAMRARIDEVVSRLGPTTLKRLLADHVPKLGIVEVLGYIQIAKDDGHLISRDSTERVVLRGTEDAPSIELTLPLVTFFAKSSVANG